MISRVFSRDAFTAAWVILVITTCLSWSLGTYHGGGTANAVAAALLALAFAKAWIVGYWFMELRSAPRVVRAVFGTWVLLVGAALVGMALIN